MVKSDSVLGKQRASSLETDVLPCSRFCPQHLTHNRNSADVSVRTRMCYQGGGVLGPLFLCLFTTPHVCSCVMSCINCQSTQNPHIWLLELWLRPGWAFCELCRSHWVFAPSTTDCQSQRLSTATAKATFERLSLRYLFSGCSAFVWFYLVDCYDKLCVWFWHDYSILRQHMFLRYF